MSTRLLGEMVSQTEGTWWSRNRAAAEDLVTFVRLHSWKDTLRNSFRLKYLGQSFSSFSWIETDAELRSLQRGGFSRL